MKSGGNSVCTVPGPALALEGGGLRALSVGTALTAGLMKAASTGEKDPTLLDSGLYRKFASLASVSGGSWFVASLVYSPRFLGLVEDVAADPGHASEEWRRRWTDPWLAVARQDGPFVKVFAALAESVGNIGLAQDILLAGYFWQTGFTWTNWTLTMLETTAGIDVSCTLGSPVQEWARDKAWLACHALAAPATKAKTPVYIYKNELPAAAIRETIDGSPGLAQYVPATYSFTLGSNHSVAAVPYVAQSAIPVDARWVYNGASIGGCLLYCSANRYTAKSAKVGVFDNLVAGASSLPVVSCAAASSAAAGNLIFEKGVTNLVDDINGSVAVWQGSGAGPAAFSEAEGLVLGLTSPASVSQKSVDRLAAVSVNATVDAGFSDTTGIAYAVAAGSTELVTYLNYSTPDHLAHLFTGSYTIDGATYEENPLPVFEQSASKIVSAYMAFPQLALTLDARFLTSICAGTLTVTTVDNALWGLRAGITITLHIVGVSSNVTIGQLEDVHDYDVLVQEVIETIVSEENTDLIQGTVLPWFMS